MRAVIQRVSAAQVRIDGEVHGKIGAGLVVLLGIGHNDTDADIRYLADKSVHLRIFNDDAGKMNRSLTDIGGEMLIVSQFTLFGDCRKGRRPGFSDAAPPEKARQLYEKFISAVADLGITVATGVFQAEMEIELTNDGPVTMLLDSGKQF